MFMIKLPDNFVDCNERFKCRAGPTRRGCGSLDAHWRVGPALLVGFATNCGLAVWSVGLWWGCCVYIFVTEYYAISALPVEYQQNMAWVEGFVAVGG